MSSSPHLVSALSELQSVLDRIPTMAWSGGLEGSATFLNRRWLDYTGLAPEQAQNWGWKSVVHSDDINGLEENWQSSLSSGMPVETEARMRRFDGAYRWFLHRANPLKDESGRVVRWFGVFIDIEDRKQREEVLRASELSWRQIVDNIPGLVATTSGSGEVEFLNRQTLQYFGKTQDELKDWALTDAVHPDDLPHVVKARVKSIEEGSVYDVEHRCRRADGVYRWFQVRGFPVRNAAGTVAAWYLLLADIEDRKKAEEALRLNGRKLSLIIDTIPTSIYILNTEGFVQFVNRAVMDYTGLSLEDCQQQDYRDRVIHPEDFKRVRPFRQASLMRSAPFETEQRVRRKDGEYRWFLVRYNPMLDEQGQIDRWYVSAFDIEDLKRAEQALQRSQFYLSQGQRLASMGSWALSAGGFDYWSPEMFKIYGLDPGGPAPRVNEYLELIPPEDREFIQQKIQRMLQDRLEFDFTKRILRRDGAVRYVRCAGSYLIDGSAFQGLVGTAMDVTDQEQMIQKLRQSEQDLRTITDTIRQPIVVLAPDGTTLYANRVVLDRAGITIDEVENKGFLQLTCHPEDLDRALKSRQAGLLEGLPFDTETRTLQQNGQYRWQLLQYNPLKDESGSILRWYATATDIDDQKRTEERLRHENVKLAQERLYLEEQIRSEMGFEQIIGNSAALKQVLELVETVATSDSTVLLLGETGTGKELIARAIHERSRRKTKTFVKLNCAAIPTGLLESELFGHEKGAFTGAIIQKVGRMEVADQGTLFLDEVGDIPVDIQPKLLRALQEKEFERLGSTHTRRVNVRLVAATNRDLEKMVADREFRSDLFYRLNVFPIRIPPLRERKEDIPLLVSYFLEKFAKQMQKHIDSIPVATMRSLIAWDWPGNIRELENFIERAVILTGGESLVAPLSELRSVTAGSRKESAAKSEDDITRIVEQTIASLKNRKRPPNDRLKRQENEIIRVLTECKGRVAGEDGAAMRMGLSRSTLVSRMKRLGINPYDYA